MGRCSLQPRRSLVGAALLLLSGGWMAACSLLSGLDDLTTGPCESPGQLRCDGNAPQACGVNGQWQDTLPGPCPKRTCLAGTCTGECEQGRKRCAGSTPQICSTAGAWEASEPACENGAQCASGVCVEHCTPKDLRCAGDTPQQCDAMGIWQDSGPACPRCNDCNQDTGVCEDLREATCTDPTAISAGGSHTCALLPAGSVKCWGRNVFGQLGLGDSSSRGDQPKEMGSLLPTVDLGSGVTVLALSAGDSHTCAVLSGGKVKCWGKNVSGQLGLGDTRHRGLVSTDMGDELPAVQLGAGRTATAVAAGGSHTCALLSGGSLKCWGYNQEGQLGLGDTSYRGDQGGEMGDDLPTVNLGPGVKVTAVAAGYLHTCALLSDGSVKCWGASPYGQLGTGHKTPLGGQLKDMGEALLAVQLGTGVKATAIAAGGGHTCALLSDGHIKCWGFNASGQLGLGDTFNRGDTPGEMGDDLPTVDLGPGVKATAISAGGGHTCAHLEGGSITCWGGNTFGQLGLGDTLPRGTGKKGLELPPIDVGPGETPVTISAGGSHTCALLSGGSLKCWGLNSDGQLGLADKLSRGDAPEEMGVDLAAVDL